MPFLPPGDLLDPGIESLSLMSPVLAGGFFTTSTTGEALPKCEPGSEPQANLLERNGHTWLHGRKIQTQAVQSRGRGSLEWGAETDRSLRGLDTWKACFCIRVLFPWLCLL